MLLASTLSSLYTASTLLINPTMLTGKSLGAFVVGLMDGDGSLQVNH